MSLLELYKNISSNAELFDKYTNLGKGKYGRMFFFKNTNYRYLKSFFEDNYNAFKVIEGINRSEWEVNSSYNQEQLKTATVRMTQSKLFFQRNRVFYRTEKGKLIEKIYEEGKFLEEEKWLLGLILLLNSYFNNIINYIQNKTNYVFENFIASGYLEEEILDALVRIITEDTSNHKYAYYEYLYMDTFYFSRETNFLSAFKVASEEEKQELYKYVLNNLVQNNCQCIISKKFKRNPSGNYDLSMLIDNAKILYLTRILNSISSLPFEDFFIQIINRYKKVFPLIRDKELLDFIMENENVFRIIYYEVNNIDYLQIDSNFEDIEEDTSDTKEDITEKIDNTSTATIKKSIRINNILKKKAYELNNYRCEFENLEGCSSYYFTSKKTHKNYLECHHFIPKEFENDFDTSIDIVENYIALCPHCHRKIHLAIDREREYLINYLFNKRNEALESHGLKKSLKEIKAYYGIGSDETFDLVSEDVDDYII